MSESYNNLCPVVNNPSSSEESRPLLLPSAVTGESSSSQRSSCQLLKSLFPPSKAANILICLAIVVGAMQAIFTCVFVLVAICFAGGKYINESLSITLSYLAMVVTVVLYPISGFLADIVFGRYRMIVASMCCIIVSFVFVLGAVTFMALYYLSSLPHHLSQTLIVLIVLASLFCLTFGIGVVAYHANFIQFGLDQLMEVPSKYLSMLIHWMIWADNFCFALIIPLAATTLCHNKAPPAAVAIGVCILCFILLNLFLVILCRKRHWFHAEPGHHNPYKMVIKVLNFARRNKYPLQRSAFTYCDDERPSRLDFAKERFGGPFSTEQWKMSKLSFGFL